MHGQASFGIYFQMIMFINAMEVLCGGFCQSLGDTGGSIQLNRPFGLLEMLQ